MPKPPLKWDDEKGICPYGHDSAKCQKWKHTNKGSSSKLTRYCSINALNREKERRAEAKAKRQLKQEMDARDKTGFEVGSEVLGARTWAKVTLVCGHQLEFKRAYLPNPRYLYPGVISCDLCDDWKDVHEVDAFEEGSRGMIFRALETPAREGNGRNTPLSSPKFCPECGHRREHKEKCSRRGTPLNSPEYRFSNSPEVPPSYRPKLVMPQHLELGTVNWMRKGTGFGKKPHEFNNYVPKALRRR